MDLDVRVERAFAGSLPAGDCGWQPARFRANLPGVMHARFHWRMEWLGSNVGAFCDGCKR